MRISDWSSDVCSSDLASNAEAGRRAKKSGHAAAIAGEDAAHVYGMKVIGGPIEDRSDNTTRFLVIGRASFPPSGNDRTSLMVSIRDQPGALYRILEPLARRGISMNRIESRPDHGRSEEHTSELQSLMRISYAVFCLKKKKKHNENTNT